MALAAIWMDLEIVVLSQASQTRQIPCDVAYMWNLTKIEQMNSFKIRSRVTDVENKLMVTMGEKRRKKSWEFGIDITPNFSSSNR